MQYPYFYFMTMVMCCFKKSYKIIQNQFCFQFFAFNKFQLLVGWSTTFSKFASSKIKQIFEGYLNTFVRICKLKKKSLFRVKISKRNNLNYIQTVLWNTTFMIIIQICLCKGKKRNIKIYRCERPFRRFVDSLLLTWWRQYQHYHRISSLTSVSWRTHSWSPSREEI